MSSPFSDIDDPELRRKLERVMEEHTGKAAPEIPPEVEQYPRYVFSRQSRAARSEGQAVRVRNGLDEESRGGVIARRLGRAYVVDVGDMMILVHEPDDSWVPFGPADKD